MASKYEIIYFDVKGLAEPIRIMFTLAGVDFTDTRLSQEEWDKSKTDMKRFPLGQLPDLLVDNKIMAQSNAISSYVAREFGFYGNKSSEGADIDAIIDTLVDIKHRWMPIFQIQNEEKQIEMKEEFIQTTAKRFFTFLDNRIRYGGGKKFVGNKISIADIQMFNMIDIMTSSSLQIEGALEPYPHLTAFFNFFKEEPLIKSFLESRPNTVY